MEKDSGARIIIRGKGSVKEGKVGFNNGRPLPGEDEPLHAYITATDAEAVRKAVENQARHQRGHRDAGRTERPSQEPAPRVSPSQWNPPRGGSASVS